MALSSVGGALVDLERWDQRSIDPPCGPTYFLFRYAFMTAAVVENHLSTAANMNTPTHVPNTAQSVFGIHGPKRTLSPGVK